MKDHAEYTKDEYLRRVCGETRIFEKGDWVRFDGPGPFSIEGELDHVAENGECFIIGKHGQEFFVNSVDDLEFVQ